MIKDFCFNIFFVYMLNLDIIFLYERKFNVEINIFK